jgi:hypothetical protein
LHEWEQDVEAFGYNSIRGSCHGTHCKAADVAYKINKEGEGWAAALMVIGAIHELADCFVNPLRYFICNPFDVIHERQVGKREVKGGYAYVSVTYLVYLGGQDDQISVDSFYNVVELLVKTTVIVLRPCLEIL